MPDEPSLKAALTWLLDDAADAGEDRNQETGEVYDSVAYARAELKRHQTWSAQWPKEPGAYWFFGKRFKQDIMKLRLVWVRTCMGGRLAYVCDGNFVYDSEGAEGSFLPAELPDLPSDEQGAPRELNKG
jgi:hypothetical protein